jgi:hypothetical protein
VRIEGVILDAQSGRPIADAYFVVLRQGVNWARFSKSKKEILDVAQTDVNGSFTMSQFIERGKSYSVGWTAEGYGDQKQNGVEVPTNAPEVLQVKLKLDRH